MENKIASREDIVNREKATTIGHYDDGAETFAKFELMKIKEQESMAVAKEKEVQGNERITKNNG